MSFVERNDYDLLDTLLDINHTIFKEYRYLQGSTTLATTPFDVYSTRRGVCQDFTNLFICLARLLGVPARYVCGYVYTGPKHTNQRAGRGLARVGAGLPARGGLEGLRSDQRHPHADRPRARRGRAQLLDATPTRGTIYLGGGGEKLEVSVRCEPVEPGAS